MSRMGSNCGGGSQTATLSQIGDAFGNGPGRTGKRAEDGPTLGSLRDREPLGCKTKGPVTRKGVSVSHVITELASLRLALLLHLQLLGSQGPSHLLYYS